MKAQSVISFVISTVIFLFLLIYIVQSTIDWISPIFLQAQENERKLAADSTLSLLVTQTGAHPKGPDWEDNPSEVTRLGISSDYLILSRDKIAALDSLDPKTVQNLLGPKYNYKICIGTGCSLADVRTGPTAIPGEKFSRGTYIDTGGKKVEVRVTVQ